MYFFQLQCVSLAVSSVISAASLIATPQPPAPHAIVAVSTYDFGTIEDGTKLVHRFQIRNAGAVPLTIGRLTLSVSGLTAKIKPAIAPGAEETLTLEWDTTRVTGAAQGDVSLDVNDPEMPRLTFTVKAVIKPAIQFVPYRAVFASVFRGEAAQRSVRIVNNRAEPLSISRVERQGDHFEAALKALDAGRTYELTVTVPATIPPGRYSEAVYLYADDPKEPRLMIPVNVLVKTEIYVNPDVVDFGRVSRADLARIASATDLLTQTIMVRKREGAFTIKSVTSDLPFVTVRLEPGAGGRSTAFRMDVGLAKGDLRPGAVAGHIRIVTDAAQFPELLVPVRGEIY